MTGGSKSAGLPLLSDFKRSGGRALLASSLALLPVEDTLAQAVFGVGTSRLLPTPLTIDYAMSATQTFVSNYAFTGQSTWISSIGPSASIRMDSEDLKVNATAGISANYFSNEAVGQGQTSEPRFSLTASLARDRQSLGLSASYYRDRQFSTAPPTQPALATPTQPSPVFNSQAVQTSNTQRNFLSISPSYSYALTERLSANVGYTFNTTYYDDQQPGLFDSTTHSVSTGLSYRLTELDQIGLSLGVSRSRTSPSVSSSESISPQISWSRSWSEKLSTSVTAGITESKSEGLVNQRVCPVPVFFCDAGFVPFQVIVANTESTSRSPTYGASVSYRLSPETGLSLGANRSSSTNLGGAPSETESITAALSSSFSERLTGGVSYSRQTSSFVGLNLASQSNLFETLSSNLSYGLEDNWSLSGGLSWSRASFAGGNPNQYTAFVTIGKSWPNNRLWPWR